MEKEFETALAAALAKLQDALKRKSALDKEILNLRQVVASLSAVADQKLRNPEADTISADEVRNILTANLGRSMTAVDIADELTKLGYRLDKYKSPLATIGVILNRFKNNGQAFTATDESGKQGFQLHPIYHLKPRRTAGGSGVIDKGVLAYLLQLAEQPKKK